QPVAVAGRVLVYVEGNRNEYKMGDVVCAAPGGKAGKMTREEVAQFPDRILGTVCSVPDYQIWADIIHVNDRVWIRI
ncbi:MAG: hypothetical protein RSD95_15825, partial [Clostridia bacterium]